MRHGWPLQLVEAGGTLLLPAETGFAPGAQAERMLLSAARAATLKLTNQRDAADPAAPVLVRGAQAFDLALAGAVADPARDLDTPMKGPFLAEPLPWAAEAAAALDLARLAGILPAFLVDPAPVGEAQPFAARDAAALRDPSRLQIAVRTRLPVTANETGELVVFRAPDDLREHTALLLGGPDGGRAPLVRLHSECLTGDVFGSLRCDCGPQLDGALARMAQEARAGGWGVLLYLRQEGRGIGLANKMRAYRLQDQGFDTLEANERLGLPSEARDFAVAGRMLSLLGIDTVRLLTNNPAKVAALEAAGIRVAAREPLAPAGNVHNLRYLATKRDRAGHLLR